MRTLRRLVTLLCGPPVAFTAFAVVPQPVAWQVTALPHGAVKPGQKFDVILTGHIAPGWHVYALEEPDGGPVATQVALAEGDPANLLRVTSAKPETLADPQFGMQTALYVNTVAFTLHLEAPHAAGMAGRQTLHAMVRYQSCNDQVCLPPHTDTVPVALSFAR